MSDFSKAFEQWAFDSRYPVAPEEAAPAPEKQKAEGSRAKAQANAPTAVDAGVNLADLLAGALKGSVSQALGIGGDVRELVNLVAEDTANKVLGERRLMTTEEVQKWLPQVVKNGDPQREHSAAVGEKIGEFLPVAPIGVAKGALKLAKSAPKTAGAATAATAGGATAGDSDKVLRYDSKGNRK